MTAKTSERGQTSTLALVKRVLRRQGVTRRWRGRRQKAAARPVGLPPDSASIVHQSLDEDQQPPGDLFVLSVGQA